MAQEVPAGIGTDRDLASIHEARTLATRAKTALGQLAEFSQEQVDALIDAMADAVRPEAESLARLAVEETGYGVVADKVRKNLFAADRVYRFIRPMRTVGVIQEIADRKLIEIAEPFGVVAGLVPSTNPTSTAIYKILIAIKARCPIVLSPHPAAAGAISRTAEIMAVAARRAGAPDGSVACLKTVSLEGTQALMKHRDVAVILATGGMGLVRAAYSAGKPAYGVGPGNAPAYIERTADLDKAVRDIITGKTFDNGVLCSAENAVVVDEEAAGEVERVFVAQGGHFLSPEDAAAVARVLVTPQRLPNPALVGKSATYIAERAGIEVQPSTRVLLARLEGVGRDYPLSMEKLCPVLAFYVVRDWRAGCERCKEILRYGGMGHTMSIHSRSKDVILEFGLKKPAFRVVVNTPTTFGSIGLTTGLDPAMTLGCGGYGGNITSDNISPRHLLNVKRLAYEIAPAQDEPQPPSGAGGRASALPRKLERPVQRGIDAATLVKRIDTFLSSRGYAASRGQAASVQVAPREVGPEPLTIPAEPGAPASPTEPVVDFVCEDDVRDAVKAGRKIVLAERAIVTPAARDLAETHKVFVQAGWRPPT